MDSSPAIVLKNIRRDIPAIKPLAVKVICLQRQLLEAVQRYQDLISNPGKDEESLKSLLEEILVLDRRQREELNLVREAEKNYSSHSSQDSTTPDNTLFCTEELSKNTVDVVKSEDAVSFRITGNTIVERPSGTAEEVVDEADDVVEDEIVDWQDLTREQWSETDRLLQKIERVGARVLQSDYLSIVDLVHVHQYKQAKDALTQKQLKISNGKRISTGPWQILGIPTKVNNRRCNYLASGVHVTVRKKDPLPSFMTSSIDCGRSSRTSSRASSPISSMTDSCSRDTLTSKFRKIKTRATKVKKVAAAAAATACNAQKSTSAVPTTAHSEVINRNGSEKEEKSSTPEKDPSTMEPCVTYSVVDGIPHFKVFFPSSTSTSSSSSSLMSSIVPPSSRSSVNASIVESEIEIIQTNSSMDTKIKSSSSSSSSSTSSKALKRPRLFQPSNNPYKIPKSVLISAPPISTTSSSVNDVDVKCGKWIDAPHFNSYRTFPSLNSTVSTSISSLGGGSSSSSSSRTSTMPLLAPKLASNPTSSTKTATAMPKLTIGNLKTASSMNKYVPIVPKMHGGGVSNFVSLSLKRPISLLKTCSSMGNSQNPSSGGSFLTVKNLKECFQQNNMNYKDMKVVVQQVSPAPKAAEETKLLKITKDIVVKGKEDPPPPSIPTVIVADMTA